MRRHSPLATALFLVVVLLSYYFYPQPEKPHHRARSHHTESSWPTETAPAPSTAPPAAAVPAGDLVKFGNPVPHRVTGPYQVLTNQGYVSGYDAGIQDPLWVETRFFNVEGRTSAARPKGFSPDPRIDGANQVTTDFWTGSGYDRGHMAPNEGVSLCYGRQAQIESFLLTNVIPQSPNLNRGLWESLEKIILNDYARRFGQVWIVDGPIFGSSPGTLRDGKVAIPERCYKIVLRVDQDGSLHSLAFEMPQNLPMGHQQSDLLQYLTSISKIEGDTSISFFPELEARQREGQERETATRLW